MPDDEPRTTQITAPATAMLDQYQDSYLQDDRFEQHSQDTRHAGSRRRFELNAAAGGGYVEIQQFCNGLTAGRGSYRLARDRHTSHPDAHTYLGFNLLLDGCCELEVPTLGLRERLEAGALWLRAGHVSVVHCNQPAHRHMQGISLDVSPELIAAWRQETPQTFNQTIGKVLQNQAPALLCLGSAGVELRGISQRMLALDADTLCGQLQFESLALDFLARVLQPAWSLEHGLTRSDKRRARLQTALDEAVDILRQEWVRPPTIAALARRIGLNECYLKAGFREQFGCTVGGYVRKLRMERAQRLIVAEGYAIKQAALAVGFTNLGYFASVFKNHYGCLPSEYGRNNRRT